MEDNRDIKELFVYKDEHENIFTSEKDYKIPLYQRAFAWADKQITQLLEDIKDCSSSKYYIGSLIVSDEGEYYEVVDGQQRLTALYLLLSVLGKKFDYKLKFACREKSNYTLEHITDIKNDARTVDQKRVQESIYNGLRAIEDGLINLNIDKDDFCEKLANVVIYRIIVPSHTDLNRYFETMNVRGEQLEQQDTLKAKLMGFYGSDEKGKKVFASIWEACSDMDGYVQMHFDTGVRDMLFDSNWGSIPNEQRVGLFYNSISDNTNASPMSIIDVVRNPDIVVEQEKQVSVKDTESRFESIIDFPYFLLHCLKVFVNKEGLISNDGKDLMDSLLDDRKLKDSFDRILKFGVNQDHSQIANVDFSRTFILHMLRMRFLFDQYIIKREYLGEDKDGKWSLQSLKVSGSGSNRKPYYVDTVFPESYKNAPEHVQGHKENLMIQSALRVSFTSPKVMHWITELLEWIENDDNRSSLGCYCEQAERHAIENIKKNFFDVCSNNVYMMGVRTPHIVFNYLDYLLWKKDKDSREDKYKDFVFEFRNSVEHWYPRNPSESELPPWDDGGVDTFGNLCLIQRNVNSKFSNLKPEGKKISYTKSVNKGSIKLRLMADGTEIIDSGPKSGSQLWKEEGCPRHEVKMIKMLKEACEPDKNDMELSLAAMVALS